MKRVFLYPLLLFLVFFASYAKATHLVGGFISYEYKAATSLGTRYQISIIAYRDCKGSVPLSNEIELCIYRRDNNLLSKTAKFKILSISRVNPVGRTDCPEATSVCLEKGTYIGLIDLPLNTMGYILQYEVCCRNTQVNLQDNSSGVPFVGMTFQAIIPPSNVKNSSPFFTDVPVPYICINDTTELNNYAIDPDGDSLVYQLAAPWQGGNPANNSPVCSNVFVPPTNIGPGEYKPGYNSTFPFGASGVSKINSKNGVTTYYATQVGNYATAIDLIEYRNGVKISSTRLDLQILVINCAPNNKPKITNPAQVYTIYGGAKLCFDVEATDKDNHNISLKGIGDILTGANGFRGNRATFNNAVAKGKVTSQFCWQTECTQARAEPYLFTVQAIDDGCPSKFTFVTISIIVKPFTGKVTVTGPSNICQGSKNTYQIFPTANTAQELIGINYNVVVTNGTLVSKIGPTLNITWDKNALTGNIEVEPVSQFGCKGPKFNFPVTLILSPPIPVIQNIDTVCQGTTKLYSTSPTAGFKYMWWVSNGTFIGSNTNNSATIRWDLPGKAQAKLVQYNTNNCPSDTAYLNVWVSKPKTPAISGPKTICPNTNRVTYTVAATDYGSSYKWFVSGGVIASQNKNTIKVNWGNAGIGMIKVLETNRFGCTGDTVYRSVLKTYTLTADTISGDTSFCEFSKNLIYSVSFTISSQYNWSITGGTIISGQLTNQITVNWGAYGTGSLSMYETSYDSVNLKQCISAPTTRIINIRRNPIQRIIDGDFEVCQLSGIGTYIVKGFAKSSYLWEINGDSSGINGQKTNTILFPYTNFGSFTFSVTETTEFGCVGNRIDSILIIHPKPTTTPITGDSIICYPNLNSYLYTTSGLVNSTFYWFIDGGTPAPSSNTPSITIDWNGQQLNSVKVLEISEFGCIGDTVKKDVFYDNPSIYLNYITVNPPPTADNGMDIFWQLKNAPRYNASVLIERRDAGSNDPFVTVGTVAGSQVTFNHSNINTDLIAYEYRVKGFDLCSKPLYTSIHTNILLTGKKTSGYDVHIDFTPYIGWGNNQIKYDVYRMLKNKTGYELYEANVNSFDANYSNGLEHYTQCYRIKATKIGTDTVTWSNEICFDFDPILFIPNAFSPNNDEVNSTFIMKGGALKSLEIMIYNRWGEKLFIGNSINAVWDGTYKGKDQPQDVYIYYCAYTGFDGRKYSTKGTITLLR